MNPGQLRWRCRRGMRELDVLLLRWLDEDFPRAAGAERRAFERLLSWQDPDIVDLLAGRVSTEDPGLRHVVERLLIWTSG
ncbi:MAG: antitoxin CptB [Pseudomonadota bacterium]|nr:antitoxin CptB [Pseudomonadota bacterium]